MRTYNLLILFPFSSYVLVTSNSLGNTWRQKSIKSRFSVLVARSLSCMFKNRIALRTVSTLGRPRISLLLCISASSLWFSITLMICPVNAFGNASHDSPLFNNPLKSGLKNCTSIRVIIRLSNKFFKSDNFAPFEFTVIFMSSLYKETITGCNVAIVRFPFGCFNGILNTSGFFVRSPIFSQKFPFNPAIPSSPYVSAVSRFKLKV